MYIRLGYIYISSFLITITWCLFMYVFVSVHSGLGSIQFSKLQALFIPTGSSSSSSSSNSNTLSAGAIAGITISVLVAVAAICVCVFIAVSRRGKSGDSGSGNNNDGGLKGSSGNGNTTKFVNSTGTTVGTTNAGVGGLFSAASWSSSGKSKVALKTPLITELTDEWKTTA